jgi:hypothetical protein
MNKKHFLKKIACLVCFIVIFLNRGYVQENDKSENEFYWINLGLGGSSYGFSVGGNASFQIKNTVGSFRIICNEEFSFFKTPNKLWDIGFMYGFISKKKWSLASISAGIGIINSSVRGRQLSCDGNGWFSSCEYAMSNHLAIGIPIETQLFLTGKHIGIGISGFANINSESSYFGALLFLQLGKLR